MGRLGGTDKASTNQRVTQLKQILSFIPAEDSTTQLTDEPDTIGNAADSSHIQWIYRNNIHLTFSFVPGNQPVRHYYNDDELKAWAIADLKPNGIHAPLWVRPSPTGEPGEYELVAGKRRYHASKFADIDPLPVRVFEWNDLEAFKASLAENKNRRNFSALEDLDGTLKLLAVSIDGTVEDAVGLLYQLDNLKRRSGTQNVLGHPQFEVVQAVFAFNGGITWESFVKTRLPLLKKPKEVLEAIRQGKIEYTKGIEIAKIRELDARLELLQDTVTNSLSLAEIKQHVHSHKPRATSAIQTRLDTTYKQFKKSLKTIEEDPKRLRRAETLLAQLEKFLEQE